VAIDVRHSALAERAARAVPAARVVSALGPLTGLAGVVWALLQPYRVTLLDLRGEDFWWLAVQPPLLVIAVGLLFHFLVARPLVDDIQAERE
jgi:hypothetical protein